MYLNVKCRQQPGIFFILTYVNIMLYWNIKRWRNSENCDVVSTAQHLQSLFTDNTVQALIQLWLLEVGQIACLAHGEEKQSAWSPDFSSRIQSPGRPLGCWLWLLYGVISLFVATKNHPTVFVPFLPNPTAFHISEGKLSFFLDQLHGRKDLKSSW